jgi:hypothetical protein
MHKLLLAAMNNNSSDIIPSFTDRRFIFKNEDGRWRCTSIFAYEAIYRFAITIQDGIRFFEAKHWRDCIPVVGHNPSMLGYAIEYALTNELRHGLALPGRLRIPQLPLFALPSGGRPRTIKESGLYVPMEFNHRYIDCVAVWFDGNNAHIVPIQITNVKKKSDHSNSEEKFFGDSEDWKLWQEAVTKPKRKIHWDFLWILNCKEAAMETRRACNGGPARRVFTTGFKSVSKEVDEALKAL